MLYVCLHNKAWLTKKEIIINISNNNNNIQILGSEYARMTFKHQYYIVNFWAAQLHSSSRNHDIINKNNSKYKIHLPFKFKKSAITFPTDRPEDNIYT